MNEETINEGFFNGAKNPRAFTQFKQCPCFLNKINKNQRLKQK